MCVDCRWINEDLFPRDLFEEGSEPYDQLSEFLKEIVENWKPYYITLTYPFSSTDAYRGIAIPQSYAEDCFLKHFDVRLKGGIGKYLKELVRSGYLEVVCEADHKAGQARMYALKGGLLDAHSAMYASLND